MVSSVFRNRSPSKSYSRAITLHHREPRGASLCSNRLLTPQRGTESSKRVLLIFELFVPLVAKIGRAMTEMPRVYRSFVAKRCAVVVCLLLSGATVLSQEQNTPLVIGQPIAREMRGGEQHAFQLQLTAGQYARVILEQKGIDVVLALSGTDGKQLLEVDNNLSGTRGMEVVSLIAEVSGTYVLTVRSLEKNASAGRYEIRLEDLRTATAADRTRVAAERAYFAGAQLQAQRTGESRRKAIEQYSEALRLMRDAGDQRGEAMTLTNMGAVYYLLNEPK